MTVHLLVHFLLWVKSMIYIHYPTFVYKNSFISLSLESFISTNFVHGVPQGYVIGPILIILYNVTLANIKSIFNIIDIISVFKKISKI